MEEKLNKKSSEVNKTSSEKTKKAPRKMKLPVFRKLHIRPGYLALGGIVTILAIFFIRVALWENNYLTAMEGSERDVTTSANDISVNESNESSDVDSTEPTEQELIEYVVAPDKPRYFTIPYLGIYNKRIVEIGLKGQGEMATPYNIYDIGWYTGSGSVLPGENGVSVMNAHGGDLGYGIFRSLPKLPVGETVKIEMGDGRVFTYRVVESVRKALGEEANQYMTNAFTPVSGASNTLTLITCTGDWLDREQTYSQRLFVKAVLQ